MVGFLGIQKFQVDVEKIDCFDVSWFDVTHLGRGEDCDDDEDEHHQVVVVSLYKHYVVCIHAAGQIIATSAEVTPNGGLVREC